MTARNGLDHFSKKKKKRRKYNKLEIESGFKIDDNIKEPLSSIAQNQTLKFKIFICNSSFSCVFKNTLGVYFSFFPKNLLPIQIGKRNPLKYRIPKRRNERRNDDKRNDDLYFYFVLFFFCLGFHYSGILLVLSLSCVLMAQTSFICLHF